MPYLTHMALLMFMCRIRPLKQGHPTRPRAASPTSAPPPLSLLGQRWQYRNGNQAPAPVCTVPESESCLQYCPLLPSHVSLFPNNSHVVSPAWKTSMNVDMAPGSHVCSGRQLKAVHRAAFVGRKRLSLKHTVTLRLSCTTHCSWLKFMQTTAGTPPSARSVEGTEKRVSLAREVTERE